MASLVLSSTATARNVVGSGAATRRQGFNARRTVVAAAAKEVPVTFQVQKQAPQGQEVRVIGEPVALGGWDVAKAPALQHVDGLWSGTVDGLTTAAAFPFKFIVVPDTTPVDPESVSWESIPDRTFQPGAAQSIKAVFDCEGFEAGPAMKAPKATVRGAGADADVKARLEELLQRLAKEAVAQH